MVAAAAAEGFSQTTYADKTSVQSPGIKKNLVYFCSAYNWYLSSVSLSIWMFYGKHSILANLHYKENMYGTGLMSLRQWSAQNKPYIWLCFFLQSVLICRDI